MAPQDGSGAAVTRAAGALVLATLGAVWFVAAYVGEWGHTALGLGLAVALAGLGYGLVTWAKHLMDDSPGVAQRPPLSEPGQRDAAAGTVRRRGVLVRRRRLLSGLGALASGALAVALVTPLRSLGPRPGRALRTTEWRPGTRLVDDHGRPVSVGDLAVGTALTVFPEGHVGSAHGQVLLLRLPAGSYRDLPGREGWTPEGNLAYSKVCTHAGCPVGLYQQQTRRLVCPCHQSAFDASDGARPVFGPATRALPQLPLAVDGEGFLVARSDFPEPVGPAFWTLPA